VPKRKEIMLLKEKNTHIHIHIHIPPTCRNLVRFSEALKKMNEEKHMKDQENDCDTCSKKKSEKYEAQRNEPNEMRKPDKLEVKKLWLKYKEKRKMMDKKSYRKTNSRAMLGKLKQNR
jgi:hypothetical protein